MQTDSRGVAKECLKLTPCIIQTPRRSESKPGPDVIPGLPAAAARALVALLYSDARSVRAVAAWAGMSTSTAQQGLAQLKARGVVDGRNEVVPDFLPGVANSNTNGLGVANSDTPDQAKRSGIRHTVAESATPTTPNVSNSDTNGLYIEKKEEDSKEEEEQEPNVSSQVTEEPGPGAPYAAPKALPAPGGGNPPPFALSAPPAAIQPKKGTLARQRYSAEFAAWWSVWEHRVHKPAAARAYGKQILSPEDAETLHRTTPLWQAYYARTGRIRPDPATFLNRGDWMDPPPEADVQPSRSGSTSVFDRMQREGL